MTLTWQNSQSIQNRINLLLLLQCSGGGTTSKNLGNIISRPGLMTSSFAAPWSCLYTPRPRVSGWYLEALDVPNWHVTYRARPHLLIPSPEQQFNRGANKLITKYHSRFNSARIQRNYDKIWNYCLLRRVLVQDQDDGNRLIPGQEESELNLLSIYFFIEEVVHASSRILRNE